MTLAHLFIGLMAAGFLVMIVVVVLDDFLTFFFDGAAPVIAVALAAAGAVGLMVTAVASLPTWLAVGVAGVTAVGAGMATRAGWRAIGRRGSQVLTPLEPDELVATTGSVLWWSEGRGKVLVEAPRGGQYQLVATSDEELRTGQSVTVVQAEPDSNGTIRVLVSSLSLTGA